MAVRRMSMPGMAMGNMDMGSGIPTLLSMQETYWTFVGVAIACAAAVNVYEKVLCQQRLRAMSKGRPTPAKPKNIFFSACATITAIVREMTYASPPPLTIKSFTFRFSPLGRIILVLSNAIVLIVLCFYKLHPTDQWQYEDIGYRAGFISVCQIPLLFLLAGKQNIIALLTGSSYERLNWLHRWSARCLLLTIIIHVSFFFRSWARYDYILVKLRTDWITQKGLGAGTCLLWIVLSSVAPVRGWSYEVFVIQHLLSVAAFVAMVYIHVPAENHVWIWIPVGLFFADRLLRLALVLWTNFSLFHRKRTGTAGAPRKIWASRATFTPLSHNTTLITLPPPAGLKTWLPGQHVFLSCHSLLPLQSHPFTIASLPEDGELRFLVKAKGGGTHRFWNHAERHHALLPAPATTTGGPAAAKTPPGGSARASTRTVSIEGPYGRLRPLGQFDTVVLIAGSTGATFTIPLLRDLVARWVAADASAGAAPIVTRVVRFVWVVKGRRVVEGWFPGVLEGVEKVVRGLRGDVLGGRGRRVEVGVWVTCDEGFVGEDGGRGGGCASGEEAWRRGVVEETTRTTTSSSSSSSSSSGDAGAKPLLSHSPSSEKAKPPPSQKAPPTTKEIQISEKPILQGDDDDASDHSAPCCCRNDTEDADAILPPCTCRTTTASPPSSRAPLPTTPAPPATLSTRTGRPALKPLIRAALEQAEGETAVVCCGPGGMVEQVQEVTVGLCDERGVHKGTGALGVWVWGERFGY